jgi:hypothetical protein
MMDIGFYVINCDSSPKNNEIISLINNLIIEYPYDNIILFNNTFQRIDSQKKFPILHISQAKYFRGVLIVFDVKSLALAKNFPSPSKIILVCDNAEWSGDNRAILWKDIYEDKNVILVTKYKELKDIIEICWNKQAISINELTPKEVRNAIT